MKLFSLLSFAAVIVAALFTFVVGSASLYAIVPCTFLILIAADDYGPKQQRRRLARSMYNRNSNPSAQTYRLAA